MIELNVENLSTPIERVRVRSATRYVFFTTIADETRHGEGKSIVMSSFAIEPGQDVEAVMAACEDAHKDEGFRWVPDRADQLRRFEEHGEAQPDYRRVVREFSLLELAKAAGRMHNALPPPPVVRLDFSVDRTETPPVREARYLAMLVTGLLSETLGISYPDALTLVRDHEALKQRLES